MPFEPPDTSPTTRWFIGRMFFYPAKELLENKEKIETVNFRILYLINRARLNILRGLRAALELHPDNGKGYPKMIKEIEPLVSTAQYEKIHSIFMKKHSFRFSTWSSIYGYSSSTIVDTLTNKVYKKCFPEESSYEENLSFCGEYPSCEEYPFYEEYSSYVDQRPRELTFDIFDLAFQERIKNLQDCLSIAIDTLGFDVYYKDKKNELIENFEFDYKVYYEIIVDQGFAENIEEAREKYDNPFDIEDEETLKLFRSLAEGPSLESHECNFWDFSETIPDAFFYGGES